MDNKNINLSFSDEESIRDYLENIISLLPGHIFWKDLNCRFIGCNNLQAKAAGLKSRDEIVGLSAYDIISKNQPEHIKRQQADAIDTVDKEIMRTGQAKTVEEPLIDNDGNQRIFLSQKIPLRNKRNEVVGLLGIAVDITEQKNIEKELMSSKLAAERANHLKTEFIENMQHDIRTPIAGIYSLLDDAYKSGDLEKLKEYLPHLVNASKELLYIHNDIIEFDDIEYGDKPIYNRKFSLLELLHSIIHLNSAAALAHESILELKVDDDVPDVIKGDNYRVSKILINLIANAIKFTEKGKVTLHIELISQKNKQSTIRFSVEDSGIGIPKEKISTIFEKFTRLNPSNRGKFKGSGLGLHVVKKFIDELGAELDVKSILGEGTIFTVDVQFELPLAQQLAGEKIHKELPRVLYIDANKAINAIKAEVVEATPIKVEQEPDVISSKNTTNTVHICLIEDSQIAMMAAENILKKIVQPCHIEKAVDVAQAKEVLKRSAFDIVVCDLGLPDGSGFDIITTVKADENHLNYKTPFVALTAHSDDARRAEAKKLGFVGFYNKPLSEDMAKKIVADHLLANEGTVIDIVGMTDMFGGNENTALEMIEKLISAFKEERILFKDAFNHNDYTRARELFHKFRGGVSYFAAPELNKNAMLLHDEVKFFEKEDKPLTDLIPQLEALFKDVDNIESWLHAYKNS